MKSKSRKETIVVDEKLQQPQPQQKAHSKCDIVKDFIEVTEFLLISIDVSTPCDLEASLWKSPR